MSTNIHYQSATERLFKEKRYQPVALTIILRRLRLFWNRIMMTGFVEGSQKLEKFKDSFSLVPKTFERSNR